MKKFLGILTGLFLIVGMSAAQDVDSEPLAYINYLEGSGGRILSQNSLEEAEINMLILQGDELRSKHSRIEIWLTEIGYIQLDHNAVVEFTILEEESVMLTIWRGNVYIRVRNNRTGIKTFDKSFNLEPGLYRIEVTGKTKVYKNPMIIDDDFDRWNDKREKDIKRSINQRHLPEELTDYEYMLYQHGNWHYRPPYGYVWIPRVSYGWKPYLHGRWVWYPIIGWTWVSYEPFGWCTYHYGRWQWDVGYGWYWIPTRYWGPSWVYWYDYGDYYAWSPMGYGSRYYRDHWDRYGYGRLDSRVWTVVHKDQLSSRNLARSVISKSELQRIPKISQNQLRTSISSTKPISNSIIRTTPTKRTKRIFRQNSTRIQSRSHSTKPISKSNVPATVNTNRVFRRQGSQNSNSITKNSVRITKSSSRKTSTRNTVFRPSPKNSIWSFLSPSRSFSRFSPVRRFLAKSPTLHRSIQKKIRKK